MTDCMYKANGCPNRAYEKDETHWTACLECIRKNYVPKPLSENYWYKSAKKWKELFEQHSAHHKKMMRRFSMRIQRLKNERKDNDDAG